MHLYKYIYTYKMGIRLRMFRTTMRCALLLLVAFLVNFTSCTQIHHHLDDKDIKTLFGTTRDAVPEHEIISISHLLHPTKRHTREIRVERAYGDAKKYHFELANKYIFGTHTKIIRSYLTPDYKMKYARVHYTVDIRLLQDAATNSALALYENNGEELVEGTLNNSHYVSAIPSDIREKLSVSMQRQISSGHHIMVKLNEDITKRAKQFCRSVTLNTTELEPQVGLLTEDYVEEVYPELLVMLDYDAFGNFDFKLNKAIVYLAALFNGVDIKYREFQNPKVKISVVAVIIPYDASSAPQFETYMVEGGYLDAEPTLNDFGRAGFLNDQRVFSKRNYDAKIGITGKTLYDSGSSGLLGMAYTNGLCTISSRDGSDKSSVLIKDGGNYLSIFTLAHELGHLLGAEHDPQDANYVMAPTAEDPGIRRWSYTSKKQIQNVLWRKSCVRNRPILGKRSYDMLIAGQLISRKKQCASRTKNPYSIPISYTSCKLMCSTLKGLYADVGHALDGTKCGLNQKYYCLGGDCVSRRTFQKYL